jgi:quercetin dioxygenase-like cupin family protein
MAEARVLGPDEGEAIWTMGMRMVIRARGEADGTGLTVLEVELPAQASPPLHIHHRETELNLVLEGTLRFRAGDVERELGPGGLVVLPAGLPHAFKAVGGPARVFGIVTPGGIESLYEQLGTPVGEGLGPVPPDPERWMRLAPEFGLEMVGPPLP